MADDLGERTEAPTPKRREEAREKGQVPRSADMSAAVVLTGAALILFFFGEGMFTSAANLVRYTLAAGEVTEASLMESARIAAWESMRLLTPALALMFLAAYADQIAQVGWNFTLQPLALKPERLNPVSGVKRIFSKRSLMKGVVSLLKLLAIAAVAMGVIHSAHGQIAGLPALTVEGVLIASVRILIQLAAWVLAALFLIGVVDLLYQRWQHTEDLKMTKQQVKDERRSSEGDPEVKSRRFQMAREIIRQRLGAAVPEADVVVTNPTHFSAALKYDSDEMAAPRLVAKGADHLAMQIRLIAVAHGVSIVERPPLARALYRNVEVGQEVPSDLYEAVAEVLAYVYRLEGRAAS